MANAKVLLFTFSLLGLSTLILLLLGTNWLNVYPRLLPVRPPAPRPNVNMIAINVQQQRPLRTTSPHPTASLTPSVNNVKGQNSVLSTSLPTKVRSPEEVYLCAIVRGRVGNALFSYMSALGLARTNNMTLLLKDESVLPRILRHPPRTAPDFDRRCSDARYMPQRHCAVFEDKLARLPHDDRYLVKTCLISWLYFTNLAHDEQRALLVFRDDVKNQAEAIILNVTREATRRQKLDDKVSVNVTLVGVHVRRTDQAGTWAVRRGIIPVTTEYLERAMRYFTDRFNPVHFLVASDDPRWCREHLARDRNDVTVMNGNSAAVDFAVLALTDHMIISIGTFGWWAGYLNRGIKTYMKDFIKPGSAYSNSYDGLNATGYIYPGWIGL